MAYNRALVFNLGRKNWAVAIGEPSGDYPARGYDCDLLALGFGFGEDSIDSIRAKIGNEICDGSYFMDSLIYAKATGEFSTDSVKQGVERRFGGRMSELLAPDVDLVVIKSGGPRDVFVYHPEYAERVALCAEHVLRTTKSR